MSSIFTKDYYLSIQSEVRDLVNTYANCMSPNTLQSPRAVGDAIEDILREHFPEVIKQFCNEYSASFARRAMADIAFTDNEGFYYIIDVKTHREDTKFNMPNLTSVERLARFYEDDNNFFCILMLRYSVIESRIHISNAIFVPIEYLNWNCLTIGALGWGQIQIANSNNIVITTDSTRKQWMLDLCDIMLEFYPKEISKINDRRDYFNKVRNHWRQKS